MAKKAWASAVRLCVRGAWPIAREVARKENLNRPERKFLNLQTHGEATRQRTKMAAPSEEPAFAAGVEKNWGAVVRSPEGTPQKIRQLIDEGIALEEGGAEA